MTAFPFFKNSTSSFIHCIVMPRHKHCDIPWNKISFCFDKVKSQQQTLNNVRIHHFLHKRKQLCSKEKSNIFWKREYRKLWDIKLRDRKRRDDICFDTTTIIVDFKTRLAVFCLALYRFNPNKKLWSSMQKSIQIRIVLRIIKLH